MGFTRGARGAAVIAVGSRPRGDAEARRLEVWTNQIPLCYIIGHNILRYQALPWHISYQENV